MAKKIIKSNKDLKMVKVTQKLVDAGIDPIVAAKEVLKDTCYSDIVKERLVVMILKEIEK